MDQNQPPANPTPVAQPSQAANTAPSTPPVVTGTTSSNSELYPQSAKDAFVNSCVSNSTDPKIRATCECTINKIEQRYTFAEFTNIGLNVDKNGLPQEIKTMLTDCATAQF